MNEVDQLKRRIIELEDFIDNLQRFTKHSHALENITQALSDYNQTEIEKEVIGLREVLGAIDLVLSDKACRAIAAYIVGRLRSKNDGNLVMDINLTHRNLSRVPRVVIELPYREAQLIADGHKNLTACMIADIRKAIRTADYLGTSTSDNAPRESVD